MASSSNYFANHSVFMQSVAVTGSLLPAAANSAASVGSNGMQFSNVYTQCVTNATNALLLYGAANASSNTVNSRFMSSNATLFIGSNMAAVQETLQVCGPLTPKYYYHNLTSCNNTLVINGMGDVGVYGSVLLQTNAKNRMLFTMDGQLPAGNQTESYSTLKFVWSCNCFSNIVADNWYPVHMFLTSQQEPTPPFTRILAAYGDIMFCYGGPLSGGEKIFRLNRGGDADLPGALTVRGALNNLTVSGTGIATLSTETFAFNKAPYGYYDFNMQNSTRFRVEWNDVKCLGLNLHANTLYVNGQYVSSDRRVKSDIQDVVNCLDVVDGLRVVQFDRLARPSSAGGSDTKKSTGVIAQDVQVVYDSAVSEREGAVANLYEYRDVVERSSTQLRISSPLTLPAGFSPEDGDKTSFEVLDANGTPYVFKYSSAALTLTLDSRATNGPATTDGMQLYPGGKVFVYGTRVSDCKHVNYNDLFCVGLGATKELRAELSRLRAEVQDLKDVVRGILIGQA